MGYITILSNLCVCVCLQVILDAWENGVNPSGNSTNPSNWDFCSSFFFAGTVVTTIGEQYFIFEGCFVLVFVLWCQPKVMYSNC